MTLLAVLLSWGSNFMGFTELFFNYFPMYNKFRTVSMILVIAEWSVPFLMAVVLQRLWCGELDRQRLMKGLRSAVLTVGGIALLFLVFGGALMSFSGQGEDQLPQEVASAMRSERASMMRADAFRSLLFVLLAAGVVWAFAAEKIKKTAFVLLLGVVQFGLSYVFLSRGLDAVSPVTASLTSTIEPILNPILVAVFYGETIGATAVIGALLVVGSATVYNVRQAKNAA